MGADAGLKYADCLKDWNVSKFITLRSPMLRNLDDYGVFGGMVKNAVDLLVTNVKTGLTSKSSTIRWGFFLPSSDAIKEITRLVEEGKVSALNLFNVIKIKLLICVCEHLMKGKEVTSTEIAAQFLTLLSEEYVSHNFVVCKVIGCGFDDRNSVRGIV